MHTLYPYFLTRYHTSIKSFKCPSLFISYRSYSSLQSPTYYPYTLPRPSPDDKVYIALSSGIDSSVTAKLLSLTHPIENLYPLYMTNWNPSTLTRSDLLTHRRPPRDKPSLFHLQDTPKLAPTSKRGPKIEKCTTREFRLVQDLCAFLGLREPLHMNFEKEYWTEVFMPMVESYEKGDTPNPDVGCNRWVKFGGLMRRLEEIEMALDSSSNASSSTRKWWLATGHYASIGYPFSSSQEGVENREAQLLRSRDANKDQTYFLSTLSPSSLNRLLFPLAIHNLTKPDVYNLARKYELPGWAAGSPERNESMGLCFVEPGGGGQGINGFRVFLSEFLEADPGDVIVGPEIPTPEEVVIEGQEGRPKNDVVGAPPRSRRRLRQQQEKQDGVDVTAPEDEGNTTTTQLKPGTLIGQHQGLWTATVGEKAHLNLPQGDARYQGRWYVSGKDPTKNQIEVVRGWGNGRLWSTGMVVTDWHWLGQECKDIAIAALSEKPPPLPMNTEAKANEEVVVAVDHEEQKLGADDGVKGAVNENTKGKTPGTKWNTNLVIQFRHRQTPIKVTYVETLGHEYEGKDAKQTAHLYSKHVRIQFETPQRAVTPGQNAAMWWGERCLGGGVIEQVIQDHIRG